MCSIASKWWSLLWAQWLHCWQEPVTFSNIRSNMVLFMMIQCSKQNYKRKCCTYLWEQSSLSKPFLHWRVQVVLASLAGANPGGGGAWGAHAPLPFRTEQAQNAEVYCALSVRSYTPMQHTSLYQSLLHVLQHKALKFATPKKQFCGSASYTKPGMTDPLFISCNWRTGNSRSRLTLHA